MVSLLDSLFPTFFSCECQCIETTKNYDTIGTLFLVVFSIIIACFFALQHKRYYSNPYFQEKIIMILFMSPFYAMCSYTSIQYPHFAEEIQVVRDCYESILLFSFFYLMFAYMGYNKETNEIEDIKVYEILTKQKEVKHLWPFNYCGNVYKLTNTAKSKYFVYRCKKFILQFIFVKLFAAILGILAQIYPNNEFLNYFNYIWEWIVDISISYSLYYLVLFYHVLKEPLKPYKPLLKFLTIKITLFFTFWQNFVLGIIQDQLLKNFDKTCQNYDGEAIISRLQNSLVCVEMFLLAIAAGFAFPYQEFKDGECKSVTFWEIIKGNVLNFLKDLRLITPKKRGFDPEAPLIQEIEMRTSVQLREGAGEVCAVKVYDDKRLTQILLQTYI